MFVGNNFIQTGPSEKSWAFKLVSIQGELATLKLRQQNSRKVLFWEIDTQTSHPRKSYSQDYMTRGTS